MDDLGLFMADIVDNANKDIRLFISKPDDSTSSGCLAMKWIF